MQQGKAIFADQLRAVAILSVMVVHWLGIYWYARSTVADYIHAEPVMGEPASLLGMISPPTFNYGPFGVSIFFLVSGFVIPFSLARSTRLQFLISRFFRIYPVYVFCTFLSIAVVWGSARYWGIGFKMNWEQLFANLMLINGNIFQSTIDLVNWSLAIEIKFYILATLLASSIRSSNIAALILTAVVICCICEWYPKVDGVIMFSSFNLSIESIKTELMVIIFMLIGVVFHFHYVGKVSGSGLVTGIVTLFLLHLLAMRHTEWSGELPYVPLNYLYGLIVFAAAYAGRTSFRSIRIVDFIARISFPLYILHSLVGYAVIRVVMDFGLNYYVAVLVAASVVIGASSILHRSVEVASLRAGRLVGLRVSDLWCRFFVAARGYLRRSF